jgi:hypothetical protein
LPLQEIELPSLSPSPVAIPTELLAQKYRFINVVYFLVKLLSGRNTVLRVPSVNGLHMVARVEFTSLRDIEPQSSNHN